MPDYCTEMWNELPELAKVSTIWGMQRRWNGFPFFISFLLLSLMMLFLAQRHALDGASGFLETFTVPLQRSLFASARASDQSDMSEVDKLKAENNKLTVQLAKQKELEKENQALHDQFQTTNPSSQNLLPAHVIGMGTFVPGDAAVEQLTIDQGTSNGVKAGQVVISKDNLVGQIATASQHAAVVDLLTKDGNSFTAETVNTSTLGVIKSNGQTLELGNVVLNDKLQKDDVVVTKGNVDGNGNGMPARLVVGKILSVNKKASDLFQAAEVKSLVDFPKLEMVFVMK